jgi:CcmD family protein
MTAPEQYVAAAYLVVFVLVLAYVLIIAAKLRRLEQALQDLSFVEQTASGEPAMQNSTRPAASALGPQSAIEAQTR